MIKKQKSQSEGQLRIIGGQWRSRKITFMDAQGLRPTPDRVRETLFNWLAPHIEGASVLDVFTGSGALFFEALSRGAKHALALDTNPQVIKSLQYHLTLLDCSHAHVQLKNATAFLEQPSNQCFDIVFLDPPFHQNLLQPCCQLLESQHWLTEQAWIYTECEESNQQLQLPANWQLYREKKAGQVHYALWHRV